MNDLKEVRFDIWCAKCKDKNTPETDKPCDECLTNPAVSESEKPINFKETAK